MDLSIRLCILLLAIPLVPLGIIRTLKYLVPFSAMATVFIMFGLAITLWYTLTDLPSISERNQFSSLAQLPLFFSTVLFAMEGIGTVSTCSIRKSVVFISDAIRIIALNY